MNKYSPEIATLRMDIESEDFEGEGVHIQRPAKRRSGRGDVASEWAVRDSLMNLYPENDPLREQLWQLWVRREGEMNTELLSHLSAKLK